jgi:hypothetical protein
MAINLENIAPMSSKSKCDKSMLSISSTYAGDSSSESIESCDEKKFMEMHLAKTEFYTQCVASTSPSRRRSNSWSCSTTAGLQDFEDGAGFEPACDGPDRSSMPSTRENSPEPMWNHTANGYPWNQERGYVAEEYQHRSMQPSMQPSVAPAWTNAAPSGLNVAHVAHQKQPQDRLIPMRSSRGTPAMQTTDLPAQRYQPQPVLFVPQDQPIVFLPRAPAAGPIMLPVNNGGGMPFAVQTMPTPSVHMPLMPTPGQAPPPAQPSPAGASSEPASERDPKEQLKSSGKSKNRRYLKSDSVFNKMSAEQKEALCTYIYDFMKEKGFTSQEGYLIVDVFSEVWKDMGDSAEGWRVAQHRFGNLLRSAPQHFRLFRRGIRVANQCGWFARKGEKMVRLVLEKEK